MKSIYEGTFKISQEYKSTHTGMDLVGLTNKKLFSNVDGVIEKIGWENPNNKKQGFGMRIWIKGYDGLHYVWGHMNYIQETLKIGDKVNVGTFLGLEGSTGCSTGSHCHYEVRKQIYPAISLPAYEYLEIPNTVYAIINPTEKDIYEQVKEKYGFSNETVNFLKTYKYKDDLFDKLSKGGK